MKKIFTGIAILIGYMCSAQSIGYWRYDTVVLQKIGGNSELKIMNATRGVTGGVLTNMGNGRTAFVTPSGSTLTSIGSGYPVLYGASSIKSLFGSTWIGIDSTSNSNALTISNLGLFGKGDVTQNEPRTFTMYQDYGFLIKSYGLLEDQPGPYVEFSNEPVVATSPSSPTLYIQSSTGRHPGMWVIGGSSGTTSTYFGDDSTSLGSFGGFGGRFLFQDLRASKRGVEYDFTDTAGFQNQTLITKDYLNKRLNTLGGTTPTLQQVFDVESGTAVMTNSGSNSVNVNSGSLSFINSTFFGISANTTTGTALNISSTTLTSGTGLAININTTGSTGVTARNLWSIRQGANSESGVTTYAGYFENVTTGTTSTNIAAHFKATQGTNNYAIYTDGGDVKIASATGKLLVGPGAVTGTNYAAQLQQPNDGGAFRAISLISNNLSAELRIGYGGLQSPASITYSAQSSGHHFLVTSDLEAVTVTGPGLVGINQTVPTSTLHVGGSVAFAYRRVTADNDNITDGDYTLSVDNGISDWTINLPAATTCPGRIYIIKRFDDGSTGGVTVTSSGGNVQNPTTGSFAGSYSLGAWGTFSYSVMFQSNGSDWEAIK